MRLTPLEEQQLEEMDKIIPKAQSRGQRESQEVPIAPLSLGSWQRCSHFLQSKKQEYLDHMATRPTQHEQHQADIRHTEESIGMLRKQLQEQESKLIQLREEEQIMKVAMAQDEFILKQFDVCSSECEALSQREKSRCLELATLLKDTPLPSLQPDQLSLVWWRMDLSHFAQRAMECGIDGQMMLAMDSADWAAMDLHGIDSCRVPYMAPILALPGGVDILEHPDEEDCTVCMSHTVGSTINLLSERRIPIPPSVIEEGGWITPYLIYQPLPREQFGLTKEDYRAAVLGMKKLRQDHEAHLASITSDW